MAGPTVVRRQLGRTLKRIRVAAGVSVDQVVAHRELGISRAKLYRMEAGQHPVKPQDVMVLCQYLGAPQEETRRLVSLALATQAPHDTGIPAWFQLFRDLEQVTSRIRAYDGELVPGLLQTAEYARAVYRAVRPEESEEAVEHQVALRMERQERFFDRDPAPRFTALIDEAVLTRRVGGRDVVREQTEHLHRLNQRGAVDIRLLPFAAGAHAAMTGAFQILEFQDPEDLDLVYLEPHIGGRYLQKPEVTAEYRRLWDLACGTAIPLKEFSR
jgi:hypothetical protein